MRLSERVKRIALAISLLAGTAFANDIPALNLDPRVDKLVQEALPVCSDKVKMTVGDLAHKLPENLKGKVVRIESERQVCAGQWIAVTSRQGGFFWGLPWFLDGLDGTLESKLKQFGWNNLQQNFEAVVNPEKTRDGLLNVTLYQTTEHGRVPIEGEVDPAGTVFFIGHFHSLGADYVQSRLKLFQSLIDNSPATGAAKPAVTVIEFSDFECPSCQHASKYIEPILEKYGSRVRYVRFDFPLIQLHPWAFSAAMAGRAIYLQKPDAFWDFKKEVYANQDKLSAFTFDDFARGFAQGHELDLKKYDADITSPAVKKSILDGIGLAFANDIRATPTYVVNGINIDPGNNGEALEAYVAALLKKQG